jgi:formylglycine-generating enzyme required for sulfatase activity
MMKLLVVCACLATISLEAYGQTGLWLFDSNLNDSATSSVPNGAMSFDTSGYGTPNGFGTPNYVMATQFQDSAIGRNLGTAISLHEDDATGRFQRVRVSDGYIGPSPTYSPNWSISLWFWRVDHDNFDFLVYSGFWDGFGSGNPEFQIMAKPNGAITVGNYNSSNVSDISLASEPLTARSWHNVVFVYSNNSSGALYVDAEFSGSDSSCNPDAAFADRNNMFFGGIRHPYSTAYQDRSFDGLMARIAIYTNALTAHDVKSEYEAISGATAVNIRVNIGPAVYYPIPSTEDRNYQLMGRDSPFSNDWYEIGEIVQGTGDTIYGFERWTSPPWLPARAWDITDNTDGYSLQFDGADDFAFRVHDTLLNLDSGMTLEAWVKPGAAGADGVIVAKAASPSITSYRLGLDGSDRATFQVSNPAGNPFIDLNGGIELTNDVWTHLAATYDGSTAKLFLNGVLDSSSSATGAIRISSLSPLVIGGIFGSDTFGGVIDEVRLWDHARTEQSILADYATKLSGNEAGLVAYWQLQEPGSQMALDTTANGLDLTLGDTGNPESFDPTWFAESFPSASVFQQIFQFGTRWFSVFWETQSNATYSLEESIDLTSGSWYSVVEDIQGTGGQVEFFEPPMVNAGSIPVTKHYRVLGPPTPPVPPTGMVLIPAGTFAMGSPTNELGRTSEEIEHQVTLTRDFFMQRSEVTNRQMADVLNWALGQGGISVTPAAVRNTEGNQRELLDLDGNSQILWNGAQLVVDAGKDNYPCVEVTWYGAQAYCNYLSDIEGLSRAVAFSDWGIDLDSNGYRLPTEAEWEYACRAGTTTAFHTGGITYTGTSPLDPSLDAAGWYLGNSTNPDNPMSSGKGSHLVGQKQPNAWGLFDMHGNLREWCGDWYGAYPGNVSDPTGPSSGTDRVRRGGSWGNDSQKCRSAYRHGHLNHPAISDIYLGFRPFRSSLL